MSSILSAGHRFRGLQRYRKNHSFTTVDPLLNRQGVRVGLIKQSHHPIEIDKPGKDSYELRKAGATQTLVASKERWALINENPIHQDPNLSELVAKLDSSSLDLILVEGFNPQIAPDIEMIAQG